MDRNKSNKPLRSLVSELMKSAPDEVRVRQLSKETGIDYVHDPIELMSVVLTKINQTCQMAVERKRQEHESGL